MADPILQLRGVTKNFGGLRVTNDVTFDVAHGEVHALIGPNGAGKSTLVGQIAGALKPDKGDILFEGRAVNALDVPQRAQAGLARVFQISNVIGPFSARDNVALAAQAKAGSSFRFWRPAAGEPGLRRAADEALDAVGLSARAHLPASVLSHGERRALELAMGLAQKPKLLLLDEPMAGAGKEETAQLTQLLLRLKGQVAMLLVEHDMGAVFALADRVTMLVSGAIAASGPPADMRNNPDVRRAYLGDEAA